MRLGLNLSLSGRRRRRGRSAAADPARRTARVRRGLGRGGVRLGQPDRAGLAGRADRAHRPRLRGDADPGADAGHDRDDRGDPGPAQRRTVPSRVSGSPGRRCRRAGTECPSSAPLGRTREYVAIVRAALAGQTVTFEGEHFRLPLPDGPGKPLKLTVAPYRTDLPIYLAAVGPKNLQLAGEIADGWLAVFFAPDFAAEQLAQIEAGRARAGKPPEGFDVVASVPLSVGRRPAAVRGSGPAVRRLVSRRDGQPAGQLLQRAGGPDGLRRRGGDRPGPLPEPPAPRRDGGGAVRVHRRHVPARTPGAIGGEAGGVGGGGRHHLRGGPGRWLGRGEAARPHGGDARRTSWPGSPASRSAAAPARR